MRDLSVCHIRPEHAVYKEVVVIGNGPSGIMMSHMLAGNWPYYSGAAHPDEMLTVRLKAVPSGRSLVQQDLRFLSQGLEGRTSNPVSLLVDTLHHPCADLGLDLPSLLRWRHHPDRLVDHVVLGKGSPGGAWQAMDGNVLTISLGSWMELPNSDYRAWDNSRGHQRPMEATRGHHRLAEATRGHQRSAEATRGHQRSAEATRGPCSSRDSRASSASVARYYADYVKCKGLSRFFRNKCVVTSVRPLAPQCQVDPETGIPCEPQQPVWCVEGYSSNAKTNASFCYLTRTVVLATGACDLPNRLQVPGELTNQEWVFHDVQRLEGACDRLVKEEGAERGGWQGAPVLIVGAGLSAADAILAARHRSLPVLHVFRKRVNGLDKQLPENMYPEYHKVLQMMGDDRNYPHYTALPEHRVTELTTDRKVKIRRPDGTGTAHRVSLAGILIGSRPDLRFLPDPDRLGQDPTRPIDCRSNPVAVDPYSYEVIRAPQPGLHALGPLAGDNFVRFIQGGALAITSHIHKERKLRKL